jgi:hypothetical protein
MDTGIVFAVVLAVLFFGGISWLIIYSRKEDQKDPIQTGNNSSETQPKSRAA